MMLKPGCYKSEHDGNDFQAYRYVMEVKETAKSYIFKLLEVENRYADDHIEIMFGGKKRIVLPKDKPCRHAMRVWSDHDFTIYPFQAGVPFYFEKEDSEEQQSIRRSVCCRGGTYNSLGATGVRGIQHSYIPLVH